MGIVLAYYASIVLRGEIEPLALKVARLASVGTRTAQPPDDTLVRRVDGIQRASVSGRDQVVACVCGLCDRVDMTMFWLAKMAM
jgi:hypothetical protein